MVKDHLEIVPSPPGFLNRQQFEEDVTHVIRRIMRDSPQSLEDHDGRQTIAETVLCELLAIDPESNLGDIEYLAEHMSEDNSGVIRNIMNRNKSPEAVERMNNLYNGSGTSRKRTGMSVLYRGKHLKKSRRKLDIEV